MLLSLHIIAYLFQQRPIQLRGIQLKIIGFRCGHNRDDKRLPCAREGIENGACAAFMGKVIAFGILRAPLAPPQVAHGSKAAAQNPRQSLRDMDAIIELVHSRRPEDLHDLSPLFLRNCKEFLNLHGIAGAGGPQNDSPTVNQLLHPAAVRQISHQRLVDKDRLALPDKGHCAAKVVIPVAAMDEPYVADFRQLLQRIASSLQPESADKSLHLPMIPEGIVVYCHISGPVIPLHDFPEAQRMGGVYVHCPYTYHFCLLISGFWPLSYPVIHSAP